MREVYTLADLRDWRAATADAQPPLRLAVLGDPVAHSASPPMHNAALAACGIGAGYTRLHIRPGEIAEAFGLLAGAGFLGVNLTLPHKTAAVPLLDEVDVPAEKMGAVNTIRVDAGGRLIGHNTDGPGFARAVQAEFGVELNGLRVLILGAGGGAGRALSVQCALSGCPRLVLVNRTFEKARSLAADLQTLLGGQPAVSAVAWDEIPLRDALQEVDLVVNASAVGLRSGDASPLAAAALRSNLLVFDTVYRADGALTPFVMAARGVGARATGGLSMLLYQGVLAFERWFARPAPVEVMRAALTSKAATDRS